MARRVTDERRWRGEDDSKRVSRGLAAVLVLSCVTLMVLDERDLLDPLHAGAQAALAPVASATATIAAPLTGIPDALDDRRNLTDKVQALESENAELRQRLALDPYDRGRLAEFDSLTRAAADLGRAVVPARVIAHGPAQSFSATVTIDAGSDAGLRPDMTVINDDGLVGRTLRVTANTATVLLVVDPESVVGGRIASSREVGFLKGRGALGDEGRLDLELLDARHVPSEGDTVLSWGSDGAGPYVAGVPVGEVVELFSSVRDQSQRAVIDPFVDFTRLDVVGVVTDGTSGSDRAVVGPDGAIG